MWREVIDCEGPRRLWDAEQENGRDPNLSSVATSKGKGSVCKGNRPQDSLKEPQPLTQQVLLGVCHAPGSVFRQRVNTISAFTKFVLQ